MIKPGLERIARLVKDIPIPWKAIHVAGTNGKGSICSTASSLLTRRKIRNGRFTSPHLIDRWDCISIDGQAVDESLFRKIEAYYTQLSLKENINASNFEILTATAFHIFTESKVDIGVVEVGMGGKLDATNVLNNQAVSVISKIARDHEAFLGNTLEEIAEHKAGILRPNVPYVVNSSNEQNVKDTITQHANRIGAGLQLTVDGAKMKELFRMQTWQLFERNLLPFQRENTVLAILAVKAAVRALGMQYHNDKISRHLIQQSSHPVAGRQEYIKVPPVFGEDSDRKILVDGAHNPDAAKELAEVVKTLRFAMKKEETGTKREPPQRGWPITWVLAMTEGKDASEYLQHLLEPGDNVVATCFGPVDGMPWVKPIEPKLLRDVAVSLRHGITGITAPKAEPLRALFTAKALTNTGEPIVMAGSLYLVGDFHRAIQAWQNSMKRSEIDLEGSLALLREMKEVQDQERHRVNYFLSSAQTGAPMEDLYKQTRVESDGPQSIRLTRQKLQRQLEDIDKEINSLTAKQGNVENEKS